jgi:kelch-like protein 2/3
MFTNDVAEARTPTISLQNIDSKAMLLLMDFIYTSEIKVTEDNVQVLLPAANILQLNEVRDACCEFLQSQLHPSNCLGIRAFADLHACADLLQYAQSYTEQHFIDVVAGDEFLALSPEKVICLVQSDNLSVPSEEKVFEAIISWVNHDLPIRQDQVIGHLSIYSFLCHLSVSRSIVYSSIHFSILLSIYYLCGIIHLDLLI